MFDPWRGFAEPTLSTEWHQTLTEKARLARGHILKMTTLAGSGHPGGSMSSLEVYLLLYHFARVSPTEPRHLDRDRIIISHGHTSPGAYAALASAGFFAIDDAIAGFRQAGSPFEGHVERSVPGIEWGTGNLGQGLPAGVGRAIYARLSGRDFHTYVMMGDGEQQKGQISEARRAAAKFNLNSMTGIIDVNRLQISGKTDEIMPQNLRAQWEADGWQVVEVDAHDLNDVYAALYAARHRAERPTVILAHSIMGKGVSFMENDEAYHGAAVKIDRLSAALAELGGIENDLAKYQSLRTRGPRGPYGAHDVAYPGVDHGQPITYPIDKKIDNRSAFGSALVSVADANMHRKGFAMGVFDCDLAVSVKTDGFAAKYPANFFQMGIAEHTTAVVTGSLSVEPAIAVWADFGVFGIVEAYNQNRLSDINDSNAKIFCTHCGVNVGEDGKTHQCIDYFALLNSTFGWKLITPADPNQTDRIVRFVLATPGNFGVVMGRSTNPIIPDENGKPFFGGDYQYHYGRMDRVRRVGENKLVLVSSGHMLWVAFEAWTRLHAQGIEAELVSVSDWCDLHPEDIAHLAEFEQVVTLEDHNVKTGLGTAIGEAIFQQGKLTRLEKIGVETYGPSGSTLDAYKLMGLDPESVAVRIRELI